MNLRRRLAFLLVAVCLVAVGLALDPRGLRRTRELKRDAERIQRENRALREENERLRANLRRLADDPQALERAAREELGLILPGEVIFHLEGQDAAGTP